MIEAAFREQIGCNALGLCRRPFSVNLPRTCAFDRLAVHLLPIGELVQKSEFVAVGLSVAGQRDAEKQVAVLADDIDEQWNHQRGLLVGVILEKRAVIVPLPDTCLRLPGLFLQAVRQVHLKVAGQRPPDRLIDLFQIHHAFQTPRVSLNVLVVVVSHDLRRKVRDA